MKTKAVIVISATLLAATSFSAQAYQIFTGLDTAGGTASTRAGSTNSDAASANFQSFLLGVGTETFESFAAGTVPPIALTFPGAGSATLTGNATIRDQGPGTNGFGRYPNSGTKFVETTSTNFAVNFGANVAAFGFYGMDIGEFGGDLQITLNLAGGGSQLFDVPNAVSGQDGSRLFYGIIAQNALEEFTSVVFSDASGSGADVFAFDDMTVGSLEQVCQHGCDPSVVPEPASLGLLMFGMAGLLAARRRKLV